MSSQSLYILWDDSQIWGLLAWRGALGLGLPCRMVRAHEIRQGALAGQRPPMLLAPGGSARLKSEALGPEGMQAIRNYVARGGHYLGICGGAGMGLSSPEDGLGLCPWSRKNYTERIQRFMSGHRRVSLPEPEHRLAPPRTEDGEALLPVWWPGRFSPQAAGASSPLSGSPTVLAAYSGMPGDDFWLADLPTRLLPEESYDAWKELYGLDLDPRFLDGQPCVVHGGYGKGSYTLSYSHLETPNSPYANAWLAKLAADLGGFRPSSARVPAWKLDEQPAAWSDPNLLTCLALARGLIDTGLEHSLLFRRNDWLYGWRTGIAGMPLNAFYAALVCIISQPPGEASLRFWNHNKAELLRKTDIFFQGARNYLLAERLAMTLSKIDPGLVSSGMLDAQNKAIFGGQMRPGGLYKEIMDVIDELAWLQIEKKH